MKNKILCLITAITLAFAGYSANANALEKTENFGKAIEMLSELSATDRENLVGIIYPVVIIDSGIDSVIHMINGSGSTSQGVFGELFGDVLKYFDADELKLALNALKIVPEDIRKTYLKAFMNREELTLSSENQARISSFMKIAYEKYSGLEKICEEDGITNGVAAKLLSAVSAANGNMPILNADYEYRFSVGYISNTISTGCDEFSQKNGVDLNAEKAVSDFAEHLNNDYSSSERKDFALLFEELGISSILKNRSTSYKNIVVSESYVTFPVIYAYFSGGSMMFRSESKKLTPVFAGFNDIHGWYEDCITELAHMGVVNGRGNGSFCPNDLVTREEFVKMICAAVNLPAIDSPTPFADVVNDEWYSPYIRTAYNYDLIHGTSSVTFGIGEYISRQDAAVICYNLLKNTELKKVAPPHFDDSGEISDYAAVGVSALAQLGVINGDGTGKFNPKSSITRAESAKIINEIIYLLAGLA